jgi:S1-C subfamily serine protease
MVVDSVAWRTPARRMGLEVGDVIVAVNGLWLRSQSDYYRALSYSGDHVEVTVQDVRTGRLITRTAHLHSEIGYRSGGPGISLELR